jgi:hypothetical protein
MARLSIGQKAQRVLRVLMGARSARIASQLAPYGFTQAVIDEGWTLLRGVTSARLDTPGPAVVDPAIIDALDAWENKWFPIVRASLTRHYPEVGQKLFLNLSQTQGADVAVSVGTLIDRYDHLGQHGDSEGANARKFLKTRGLTAAVIEAARTELRAIEQIAEPRADEEEQAQQAEARTTAEDQMWAWYLEWSQIIRSAVKNRRLLQQLGFLVRRGGATVVDDGSGDSMEGDGMEGDGMEGDVTSGVPSSGAAAAGASTPAVATTARPAANGVSRG